MKKKIGILTFHKAHNYGAVLQVAALIHFLVNNGFYAEAINYLSPPNKRYRLFLFFKRRNILKLFWELCFVFWRKYIRHKAFEQFIATYVTQSQHPVKNIDGLKGMDYDVYVVGSDQVWNTRITSGFDDIYWGNFTTGKKATKISYAASSENYPYDQKDVERVRSGLRNFDALSVRENRFAAYLQQMTSQEISTVVDPTLLVPSAFWDDLAIIPKNYGRFVLVYQVVENRAVLSFANKLKKQLDSQVFEMCAKIKGSITRKNIIETASPEEFLGYFKTAQCVVTTSFHGTAFSLIFGKPFYFIKLQNNANRSTALLHEIGLQDRIVSITDDIVFSDIDYECPNQALLKKRALSSEFLENAL